MGGLGWTRAEGRARLCAPGRGGGCGCPVPRWPGGTGCVSPGATSACRPRPSDVELGGLPACHFPAPQATLHVAPAPCLSPWPSFSGQKPPSNLSPDLDGLPVSSRQLSVTLALAREASAPGRTLGPRPLLPCAGPLNPPCLGSPGPHCSVRSPTCALLLERGTLSPMAPLCPMLFTWQRSPRAWAQPLPLPTGTPSPALL